MTDKAHDYVHHGGRQRYYKYSNMFKTLFTFKVLNFDFFAVSTISQQN